MLQGEIRHRLRVYAVGLVAAAIACGAFVPSADAGGVRHYERVSPAEKGNGDIVGDGVTTVASRGGDAVAFASLTAFGDTVGSGVLGQTEYTARRNGAGWLTHSITPMSRPDALQTFVASTKVEVFSDDLSTAVTWGYDLPGGNGTPNRENTYVEDTATRALQPVTVSQADALGPFDFVDPNVWGVSADVQHLGVVSNTLLLPDAAPGVPNAYAWDHGVLSLAGILPDGTVPAGGSTIAPMNYRGAMSADGTRLAFTSPADGNPPQLYLRIGGARTVWVSQPEGSDPSEPANVSFQGMTPDGQNVFFVTDSALLDADTNPGPDLYRYTDSRDPQTDANLTLISHDGAVPGDQDGTALVGMSDDARQVYYQGVNGELSVWNNGVTTRINSDVLRDSDPQRRLAVTGDRPGFARVSPDGTWLAFLTRSTVDHDSIHGLAGQLTNGYYEMYVYKLGDDRLTCASCPATPAAADTSVVPAVTDGQGAFFSASRPRFLSDSGQVFFSTSESLLPQDVNGVADTYEYDADNGALSLLSTGKGNEPAMFTDASASGDDVFIVTRQQLVSADRDAFVDLYDVRAGTGSPEPLQDGSVPCDGDGCQAPPAIAPPEGLLGSLSFEDGGLGRRNRASLTVRDRAALLGTAGSLRLRLGAPGRLEWSGHGLRGGTLRRKAGSVVLPLRLNARARKRLNRAGRYVTTVRLTLHADDGTSAQKSLRVTFRAATKGR